MNRKLLFLTLCSMAFGFLLTMVLVPNAGLKLKMGIPLLIAAVFFAELLFFAKFFKPKKNDPQRQSFFKGETRLAASLQEAIIIVDDKLRMVHINPSAHALFPDIRAGESIRTISNNEQLIELASQSLSGQTPIPFVYQVYDPIERHIRVTGSILKPEPVLDEKSRAVIIFYDVTDLERANALRADFLANASHELKTPVASLLGYIETLNGHAKDDPEAQSLFLGIMQQQAERMQRLINDILSLRRIELSEHKAPTETADLYLAYLAAKESVAPMAKNNDVKIKYSGPKELLVTGKQDELVQLVLNIIDNGVKMSKPGTKLVVEGEMIESGSPHESFSKDLIHPKAARRQIVSPPVNQAKYGRLKILDTGPGFDQTHLPRLTERFYRIAGDRNSQQKGTGLGLAIVKHIVMRHRGGLLIETAKDFGTEFTILIPLSAQATASEDILEDDDII